MSELPAARCRCKGGYLEHGLVRPGPSGVSGIYFDNDESFLGNAGFCPAPKQTMGACRIFENLLCFLLICLSSEASHLNLLFFETCKCANFNNKENG